MMVELHWDRLFINNGIIKMKKTYIIGDIHGEYDTLIKLIEKLPFNAEIIFVGDLIDRGAKSREVIELIRKKTTDVYLEIMSS